MGPDGFCWNELDFVGDSCSFGGLDVTLYVVSRGPIPCSHTVVSTLNVQKVLFNVFSFQAILFVLFLSLM